MPSPTELTYFTVSGDWYALASPEVASDSNKPRLTNVHAYVDLVPRVPRGFTVQIDNFSVDGGDVRPTSLVLATVRGRIMNGRLSVINSDDTNDLRLLANTKDISDQLKQIENADTKYRPAVDDGELRYDVRFTAEEYMGKNQTIQNFSFIAPTSEEHIVLTDPNLGRHGYRGP